MKLHAAANAGIVVHNTDLVNALHIMTPASGVELLVIGKHAAGKHKIDRRMQEAAVLNAVEKHQTAGCTVIKTSNITTRTARIRPDATSSLHW